LKRYLNRKSFVTTLGAAGLGLGLAVGAVGGAPSAMAQDSGTEDGPDLFQDGEALQDGELKDILIALLQEEAGATAVAEDGATDDVVFQRLQDEGEKVLIQGPGEFDPAALDEKRAELYAEFTAALAEELGISNADEVDAAIRIAMMSVVDARVEEGHLTAGQAEAVKFLIATSDVPVPAMGMGGHHGRMFIAAHGPGFGPGGDHMLPGRAGARERIIEWAREAHSEKSDKKAERDGRAEKGNDSSDSSDSQSDEDEQG
jgi:hypothetical protein